MGKGLCWSVLTQSYLVFPRERTRRKRSLGEMCWAHSSRRMGSTWVSTHSPSRLKSLTLASLSASFLSCLCFLQLTTACLDHARSSLMTIITHFFHIARGHLCSKEWGKDFAPLSTAGCIIPTSQELFFFFFNVLLITGNTKCYAPSH